MAIQTAEEMRAQLIREALAMDGIPIDEKLEACKAEVDLAMGAVTKRVELMEEERQIIHKIYELMLSMEQRVANLSLSFATSEAKSAELHNSLPPEKIKTLQAIINRNIKKEELYEKLTYKLTESGLLGLAIFLLGLLAMGFWHWLQTGLHK